MKLSEKIYTQSEMSNPIEYVIAGKISRLAICTYNYTLMFILFRDRYKFISKPFGRRLDNKDAALLKTGMLFSGDPGSDDKSSSEL